MITLHNILHTYIWCMYWYVYACTARVHGASWDHGNGPKMGSNQLIGIIGYGIWNGFGVAYGVKMGVLGVSEHYR